MSDKLASANLLSLQKVRHISHSKIEMKIKSLASNRVKRIPWLEGRLLKASRYWFKLMTSDEVLYVNKAHVISISPLEITPPVQRATREG
jgi:hypothetical protein